MLKKFRRGLRIAQRNRYFMFPCVGREFYSTLWWFTTRFSSTLGCNVLISDNISSVISSSRFKYINFNRRKVNNNRLKQLISNWLAVSLNSNFKPYLRGVLRINRSLILVIRNKIDINQQKFTNSHQNRLLSCRLRHLKPLYVRRCGEDQFENLYW